mgnify:CR=1 FL=1
MHITNIASPVWFGVPDMKHFRSKKDGEIWHSSWGEFRIGAGSIEPVEGGFMDQEDITVELSFTSQGTVVGRYEIGSIKETGIIADDFGGGSMASNLQKDL